MALWHIATKSLGFLPLAYLTAAVPFDIATLRSTSELSNVAGEVNSQPRQEAPVKPVGEFTQIPPPLPTAHAMAAGPYPLSPKSETPSTPRAMIFDYKLQKPHRGTNALRKKESVNQETGWDGWKKKEGALQAIEEMAGWQSKYSALKDSAQTNMTWLVEQLHLSEVNRKKLQESSEAHLEELNQRLAGAKKELEQVKNESAKVQEENSRGKKDCEKVVDEMKQKLISDMGKLVAYVTSLSGDNARLKKEHDSILSLNIENARLKKEHEAIVQENQELKSALTKDDSRLKKEQGAVLSLTEENARLKKEHEPVVMENQKMKSALTGYYSWWKKEHDAVEEENRKLKSALGRLRDSVLHFTETQSQSITQELTEFMNDPTVTSLKGSANVTQKALNELDKLRRDYK